MMRESTGKLTSYRSHDDTVNFAVEFASSDGEYSRCQPSRRRRLTLVTLGAVAAVTAAIGAGILIGYFGIDRPTADCASTATTPDSSVTDKILQMISATNIRQYLREYTSYSHMAGTQGNSRQADSVETEWKRQGLHVVRRRYDVLLSFPNTSHPSYVELIDSDDRSTLYRSSPMEDPLGLNISDAIPPFNAYSPPGDVHGELVYVNYAEIDDFRYVQQNLSIDITDKIVIAKFGRNYRGDKVRMAAEFGAAGIILYMDPVDFAPHADDPVYPHSWWLPGSGLQRGTTLQGDGDPLTPGYPSTDSAFRIAEANSSMLTRIPVHPIGYNDAYHLLRNMSGPMAPSDWQGGLNFTYHIGPGHSNNLTVHLFVSTGNQRANISNVFGFINGSVEPDRYVILGNHRDAWVFGGVDATSGTALMMELSRVVMDIVREGPSKDGHRDGVSCSAADAEEYGLIGSFEWVEDFVKLLGTRAVAYLNVDYTMEGNMSLAAGAMPTMFDLIYRATKLVKSPNNPSRTVFDDWLKFFPEKDIHMKPTGLPEIYALGDGSDFGGFMLAAGVPCYDIYYTHNLPLSGYPLYHTIYDDFLLYDSFLDPQYKISTAIGQIWGETMRHLVDEPLLPLNMTKYADVLGRYVDELDVGYGHRMRQRGIIIETLCDAVTKFGDAATDFHKRVSHVDTNDLLQVRMVNDQMMAVDRAFIDPAGVPHRPFFRHVIYAPSMFNSYAGSTFPGLVDLMHDIDKQADVDGQWDIVRQHYATIIFCVESATAVLRPPTDFMVAQDRV